MLRIKFFAGSLIAAGLIAVFPSNFGWAQTVRKSDQAQFRIVSLAKDLSHPWSLAFLPGGDLLVTERSGRLRLVRRGVLEPEPIKGLPKIDAVGQGGLLDVALHPDFNNNNLVYFSYSARNSGGVGTVVARGRLQGNSLRNVQVMFQARPKSSGGRHFGSRLLFDPQGYLFITLGDRGRMQEAQRTSSHLGSVIRLHDDGRVPSDNPFVNQQGALPEIYSYGHRNVQGIALHPSNGQIWVHEHGPKGGDEVNILRKGANYGWPAITYGIDYSGSIITEKKSAPGMEQPVIYWVPSIAPSGMAFYSGDRFPNWKGDIFVGALAGSHLRRLEIRDGKVIEQEQLLKELGERIRDVRSGPDGFLYVLTDSSDGQILRLEPVSSD